MRTSKRKDPRAEKVADKRPDSENKAAARAENAKSKRLKRDERARATLEKRRIKREKTAERIKTSNARRARRQKIYGKIKNKFKNSDRGFDYRNIGIAPRVELEVTGDAASVISKFSNDRISIVDFRRNGKSVLFKIRKKDLRKAVAILDGMCYNYTVGESYGIARLGAFWLARIGLILGAAAAVLCLNISYSYIWRIKIDGCDRLSEAAVESVLRDFGFRPGLKKSDLDCHAVSAAVNSLSGVSDASAEVVGTTLKVHILESDEHIRRDVFTAFEASYDATVTRIVLRSGSSRVARGDVVKRGDILADGSVYSTSGELLYVGECDADVYGDVSVTYTAELSASFVEFRRTGNVTTKTCFTVFGHRFFDSESPYTSYEIEARTANYDVLLPVYVTTYTFYETAPVTVERDIEEVAREYAKDKTDQLKFVGEFDTSYTLKQTVSGLYRVNLFLSGEALISRGTDLRVVP